MSGWCVRNRIRYLPKLETGLFTNLHRLALFATVVVKTSNIDAQSFLGFGRVTVEKLLFFICYSNKLHITRRFVFLFVSECRYGELV